MDVHVRVSQRWLWQIYGQILTFVIYFLACIKQRAVHKGTCRIPLLVLFVWQSRWSSFGAPFNLENSSHSVLRDCTVLLHDLVIVVWLLAVMNILSKRVVVLCRALFRNWCQPMRRIEPRCWQSWSRRLASRQKGVPKAQVMIGSSLCAVFPLYIAFHASLLHAIDGVMS